MNVGDLQWLKTAPLEEDLYVDKIEVALQNISDGQATNQATNKRCFLCVVLLLISVIVAIALMFWYFTNSPTDRENGFKHLPTIYLPNITDSTFFGRHWLFQELEDRINSSHNDRGILIVGEPGLGKPSIMRQLIITPESSPFIHRNIIAYHF